MVMRSSTGVSQSAPNGSSRQQQGWERLTELLEKCDGRQGLKSLNAAELRELQRLYRSASSDLSLARSQGRQQLADYLNQLLGRAHGLVYARPPQRRVKLGEFFGVTLPRTCKRNWPYWAVSLAILFVGSGIGFSLTARNPAWAEVLVSRGMREMIEPFVQDEKPAGEYFQDAAGTLGGGGGFSSVLMTNNIRVALLCFALGISFGLGTLYVLAQNALMLGSALGLGAAHGKLLLISSVVAPHGVVELSAVVLAGAAGLRLGYALVNPEDLLRRDALMLAARDAGQMALGTVPMFIYAGLVEGIVSPQSTGLLASDVVRVLIGLTGGLLLYCWLLAGDLIFGSESSAFRAQGSAPTGGLRGLGSAPTGGLRGLGTAPTGGLRGQGTAPTGGLRGQGTAPTGGLRGQGTAPTGSRGGKAR